MEIGDRLLSQRGRGGVRLRQDPVRLSLRFPADSRFQFRHPLLCGLNDRLYLLAGLVCETVTGHGHELLRGLHLQTVLELVRTDLVRGASADHPRLGLGLLTVRLATRGP